jgi:glycosyltransferase involved in cell wall biosynthesis
VAVNTLTCQFPINKLSYGICGFNILKELNRDINCNLFQIGNIEFDYPEDQVWLQRCINAQKLPDFNSPTLKLFHQHTLGERIGGKSGYYGFPIFELDKFDFKELEHLKVPDHLFVTSEWGKQVLVDNGIKSPITVIPLGINEELIYLLRAAKAALNQPRKTLKFLSCGKWEVRKWHDQLYEAFDAAFETTDDVELSLMPHNFFLKEAEVKEWENLYKNSKMGQAGKVTIIPRQNLHEEAVKIINYHDVYLGISRAEGWNLPLHEALALGKPTIITPYSAPTQYIPSADSLNLNVKIDGIEQAYDGKWFFGQGNWCKINFDSVVESMRAVYKRWKNGDSMLNTEGIKVGEKYTWENTAKLIKRTIFNEISN